jgi:hypothetical protein
VADQFGGTAIIGQDGFVENLKWSMVLGLGRRAALRLFSSNGALRHPAK